jgi:hypothetical protein
MSALWRVSLMRGVLNRSLLNREYLLIISRCNLHVTLLSKITPRYFMLFTNGMSRPFNVRWWTEFLPESRYITSAPTSQKTQLYCCVSTNCRRDVFTSALRSNNRGADYIENSLSVEVCLPSRCLATLWANPLQYYKLRYFPGVWKEYVRSLISVIN